MPVTHTIEEGDSITSLAAKYGHFVETIWNDPGNRELKLKRKDMDILLPGDEVVIPDKRIVEREKPTDQKHRFKRKGVPAVFRLQVFDDELPRTHQDYVLKVDGRIYQGTTDDKGTLHEFVDPCASEGDLVIGPDNFRISIQFGCLDPAGELAGVQKRLENLGYWCGEASGEMNSSTEIALTQFQRRFELEESGRADEATVKKLQQLNDTDARFPERPADTDR